MKFEELGLSPQILRAVQDMGFEEASPIQAAAIPVVMSGRDMIGQAQTGTGKTASFGIPVLEKVDPKDYSTQVLILAPTRELAIQSSEELHRLSKYMHGVKIVPIYGGADMARQIRALKDGVQIIIGTPGRVMDHLRRGTLTTEHIHTIVLDEADEMLNMGFREDIEAILDQMPEEGRQMVLFSATMAKPIMDITTKYQKDAELVKVAQTELTVPNIDQYYYDVRRKDKTDVLTRLLDYYSPKLSLVFCNTKSMVDELAETLQSRGYAAEGLHGDMKQSARDRVMKRFRSGKVEVLIATDVAARGIDVDDVEAVFNYDIPREVEYYVHRIGRTGRAGRAGRAFSFVRGKEVYKLRDIQRYCKTKIVAQHIPTLADVQAMKTEKVMDDVLSVVEAGGLHEMIDIIETQINTSDYTAMDIAAAFLKKALEGASDMSAQNADGVDTLTAFDKRGEDPGFDLAGERPNRKKRREREFGEGHDGSRGEGGRGRDGGRDGRDGGRGSRKHNLHKEDVEVGMTRFKISLGKKHGIRPNDVVRIISSEAHIPGRAIGAIELNDNTSYVELPSELSSLVLKSMKKVKFKGKKLGLELAFTKKKKK
ncbi:DEAD/DEAH box helicase [Alloscardovia macacae]|uniref:RNA helicase n=1 Tax=Alloscardovia macacae TaxID=1160091 RepID=A0A261F838_9BIFI|nr:DEAD/DEAH box helicase [Alloscardovia macacae]OZG55036.1 DEAD/DEAH box family ATP-dependent RNA helicase [Alloscardovia macacae]